MTLRRVVAALTCVLLARSLQASTDALVQLCRVWSAVKFLDPQLMTREVDWDAALLRAIPAARLAKTTEEEAAAIGVMLHELGDPATRVARAPHEHAKPQPFSWDGDVLIVNIGPYADSVSDDGDLLAAENALAPELAKARAVVFDLRTQSAETPAWLLNETALVDQAIAVPAQRYVFRSGYAPQPQATSGGYYSALQVVASSPISAAPKNARVPSRIVLITGDELPSNAAALWWSGRAAIVSTRPGSGSDAGKTQRIDLGNGWTAFVRVSEAVHDGLTPDAAVDDASAMTRAIALARDPSLLAPRPSPRVTASVPVSEKENPYVEMSAPDVPYRLLALFRLWSVIDRFYPYKNLLGDWDAVLREFIPRFEAAEGADAYARTVMELAAHIEDGHTQVYGPPAVWDVIGPRLLPLEVRPVEGSFIVTAKRKALPADADVAIGDEIVTVDGVPLPDRIKHLWKYFTASTQTARLAKVANTALRGPRDSTAELVVRGASGKLRTVKIARTQMSPIVDQRPVWRVIDRDIGYIDLTRLMPDQVDAAFDTIKDTRALIFDMRGYPNGTGWSIASRINRNNATVGALFSRPQISVATSDQANARYRFEQRFATTDKPKYTGRTVMLIDDRALSQAEHTGLWFEAASGTKFVGSNSAGANGDVTTTVLPGGIYVAFTGHEVRHADGRQLQRIGLVPDVRVTPTIRGIRSGKDEVLDRAIAYLGR